MTESTGKPDVLCVGRLYCDLIFTDLPRMPTLGTEVFAECFGAHAGGGAFITAAHLSAMGHRSSLAAMLPSSPFSDLMRSDLEASQVDLSLSASLPEISGPQLTVAMAQGGDRAFLTRRSGAPFPALCEADLADRRFRHLHIGEAASLLERPEILDVARALNMSISVDCGWDDTLEVEMLQPFTGRIDVFLPNETEWAALRGKGFDKDFANLTVIKKGADGAAALCRSATFDARTEPVEAKDTTGAGDAFNAGFLSAWLSDSQNIAAALDAGNARGRMTVQQSGGFAPGKSVDHDVGVPGE